MAVPAPAQDMEPRSYSPSPVGMNFAAVSWAYSSGGVAVDPTIPIDKVDASFNFVTPGYSHTFGLGGHTASVAAAVPFAWGEVSGDVFEERRAVSRQGFGDPRFRLAVNLVGGPARNAREFATRIPETAIGASLVVIAPLGEYMSNKFVNLGSNRWAFKPELGLYQPFGKWAMELSAGTWIFTDNDDFFGGVRREQEALMTAQLHFSYTFRPRLWIAASGTWYAGGSTTVDGVHNVDRQDSTRAGITMSIPVSRQFSLKLGWADGVTTRIGSDFSTYTLAWQYAWPSRPPDGAAAGGIP